jgi:hypothetical protein
MSLPPKSPQVSTDVTSHSATEIDSPIPEFRRLNGCAFLFIAFIANLTDSMGLAKYEACPCG